MFIYRPLNRSQSTAGERNGGASRRRTRRAPVFSLRRRKSTTQTTHDDSLRAATSAHSSSAGDLPSHTHTYEYIDCDAEHNDDDDDDHDETVATPCQSCDQCNVVIVHDNATMEEATARLSVTAKVIAAHTPDPVSGCHETRQRHDQSELRTTPAVPDYFLRAN